MTVHARRRHRTLRSIASIILAVAGLAAMACAESDDAQTGSVPADGRDGSVPVGADVPDSARALAGSMRERAGIVSIVTSYASLVDLLPNTTYVEVGAEAETATSEAEPEPITTAAIAGTVTEVEPDFGAIYDGEDPNEPRLVEFDDPAAWVLFATLVVDVEEELGPGQPVGDEVRVGVALPPGSSVDELTTAFHDFGLSVMFLETGSPVFTHDPSLYSIVENGFMFATVADDGALALPFIDEARADELLAAAPTLDALRAAAEGPGSVIEYDAMGNAVG
jgi:hypothetical protein